MRRLVALLAAVAMAVPSAAGPLIDRTIDRGYVLSVPDVAGSEFRTVGLAVILPREGASPKDERGNWAVGCEQFGVAQLVLDINYDEIQHEGHIDGLFKRIQKLVTEVTSANPSVDRNLVFIAGTGRGGMAALALALRHPGVFKGVGVASGAMMGMGAEDVSANAAGQYFFFAHGERDRLVPMTYVNRTLRRLSSDGAVIETHLNRRADHVLRPQDYAYIAKWMAFRMGRRPVPSPLPN